MKGIKKEIDQVINGKVDAEDNVLHNAPHPIHEITADEWHHSYSRSQAAYPVESLRSKFKFWPTIARVDNAYGDRNLVCTCPPIESYEMSAEEVS
jgi:glycine dehydrogenase